MITSTGSSATVAPFSLVVSQELNVAVGTNPKDAGSAKQYKTANDLKQEESKGVTLQVLDGLANLGGSNASNQRVTNVSQFLATITEPKLPTQPVESLGVSQTALVVARSSHPAIGGVVVVHSPLGGVGSGFFIDEYTVLTNFHVVEDSDYVEIELFDGRSTTGQVLDFDIDRDLALVRTSIKGQPLELFSGNTLPLGESVTAIGHPGGLNFTITKGIISAVREQKATTSLGLGASFLFVQTDTAINPGNSGGPLLLDNKVIGINTQKLVDVQIEGIGFALHYTEIARYLAASMSN
jgi:serine protease Do